MLKKICQKKPKQAMTEPQFERCSFHDAMQYSLKLAQWFSFFPINLNTCSNYEVLKFKWLYWRVFYSALTFSVFIFEFCLVVYQIFRRELSLLSIKVLAFHLGGLIQYILFFKLSISWYKTVREMQNLELRLRSYGIVGNLRRKLNYITTIIMTIAGIEHGLVNTYKLIRCLTNEPQTYLAIKNYFVTSYDYVFEVCQYSVALGVLLQITNLQRTFNWSYADVFIMLIGSAFTFRLKQLTGRIRKSSQLEGDNLELWASIRRDYLKLSEICEMLNDEISSIIIMCYSLNLYFVLIQLFLSLRTIYDIVEKVYFYLSFFLLILRIVCLSIFAGSVYEEWRNIRFELNCVNSATFNGEVDRLIRHLLTWELTLSGKNFFHISRRLVLKIAGAIVTYELVLIQFYYNSLNDSGQK